MIMMGVMFIVAGAYMLYKSTSRNRLYKELKVNKLAEYKKTTGKVIANAFELGRKAYNTNSMGPNSRYTYYTPVVEYEVDGIKYESRNEQLSKRGKIPVGTEVKVYYKKDDPRMCVLETEMGQYKSHWIEIVLFIVGIIVIIMSFFVDLNSDIF